MIAVIDYKAGNLKNVAKAFEFINTDVLVTQDPDRILNAQGVVLPGVGAFADCMKSLKGLGLDNTVKKVIEKGIPFLGICLGFQMLFSFSEENENNGGVVEGLGIFKGAVWKFPEDTGLKIPHMGWNRLIIEKESPLFEDLPENPYVYFVHSYYLDTEDKSIVSAKCSYGTVFDAAVSDSLVFGTQFHPEKSGETGIAILKNFVKVVLKK